MTIDDTITRLVERMDHMEQIMDSGDIDPELMVRVLSIYAQACSRLGRLLRDKRALTGEAADGFAGAIAQALDELSSELGADL